VGWDYAHMARPLDPPTGLAVGSAQLNAWAAGHVEPSHGMLEGFARAAHPGPKTSTSKSRSINNSASNPFIRPGPVLRLGPNRSRCARNISSSNSRLPAARETWPGTVRKRSGTDGRVAS